MAFWWRAAWMTLTQGIGNKIDDLSYRRFSLQLAESAYVLAELLWVAWRHIPESTIHTLLRRK